MPGTSRCATVNRFLASELIPSVEGSPDVNGQGGLNRFFASELILLTGYPLDSADICVAFVSAIPTDDDAPVPLQRMVRCGVIPATVQACVLFRGVCLRLACCRSDLAPRFRVPHTFMSLACHG